MKAGLIVANADQLKRAGSSLRAVYQIDKSAQNLLRTFGSPTWNIDLAVYLSSSA